MSTNLLTDTSTSSDIFSTSSFTPQNTNNLRFSQYNSYLNPSQDQSQIRQSKTNTSHKNLSKDTNKKFLHEKLKSEKNINGLNQSSFLIDMISDLEKKKNYIHSTKNALNHEKKHKNIFLKSEDRENNFDYISESESQEKYLGNNTRRNSRKVEKYIDAISNIDAEIHKCIQSIDSKSSFLNQSKTEFLKINNQIDLINFKIANEKKQHEITLMKYKNEFKRLAKERNEINKLQFERPMKKYNDDYERIQQYNQIKNSKEELTTELKIIRSKKIRSNNRLERMESQLKRLIRVESNLKNKSKKISKRDKRENIITSLLNKLEQKLKDKQIKKEKQLHNDQIETQILLRTFDNLQQTIEREENNKITEQIHLPDFPLKIIQKKNQNEEILTKISDEINVVQNDIKYLKKQIQKIEKTKEKYQKQLFEFKNQNENQILNNNVVFNYHRENVNAIFANANDYLPNVQGEISRLLSALAVKKNQIRERKRKMLSRCENYFTIIYEYGKKWQE